MPTRTTVFDGVFVKLSVSPAWWSWFWLGLVYQPLRAKVTIRRNRKPRYKRSGNIVIHAIGWTNMDNLQDMGTKSCNNSSSCTMYVHNIGFPAPPWLGGGALDGVGFRATVTRSNQTVVLHCHWGDGGMLPDDHR